MSATWVKEFGDDFWWADVITHSCAVTFAARIREYDRMCRVYGAQALEAKKAGNYRQYLFCQYKSDAYECALRNEREARNVGFGMR